MEIRCDLHIHSALSPCALNEMTPNNIVNMALLSELQAIAVTDHNACGNAGAAMKVALGTGLVVVPGLEVQTREEVHIVTLFPEIEEAKAMEALIQESLPPMKASAKTREKQLILDEADELVGTLDKPINMSCGYSVEQVAELAEQYGGVAIPAHIDRKSYSLLSNLGFIPKNLQVTTLEVSMYGEAADYRKLYPAYRIITNSDAHELGHIGMVFNEIEVESVSARGIIRALKRAYT